MNKQYTVDEVAEVLGRTPYTVRTYLKDKVIKGYKLGRDWRVDEDELTAYLKKLQQGEIK